MFHGFVLRGGGFTSSSGKFNGSLVSFRGEWCCMSRTTITNVVFLCFAPVIVYIIVYINRPDVTPEREKYKDAVCTRCDGYGWKDGISPCSVCKGEKRQYSVCVLCDGKGYSTDPIRCSWCEAGWKKCDKCGSSLRPGDPGGCVCQMPADTPLGRLVRDIFALFGLIMIAVAAGLVFRFICANTEDFPKGGKESLENNRKNGRFW